MALKPIVEMQCCSCAGVILEQRRRESHEIPLRPRELCQPRGLASSQAELGEARARQRRLRETRQVLGRNVDCSIQFPDLNQ